ncbi:MAG: RNA methyltransferase [Ahrensia sp.]|nr:RNA methyltransferase [Ahrensia sp.]
MTARGYFGIGIEGASKPMNFGNLSRTAYGFGASFVFTVSPGKRFVMPPSDTTKSGDHMPHYDFSSVGAMALPQGCRLVGVELTEDAVDLPGFRHPTRAAYVLGPENGSLSPQLLEACEFVVKIPTCFCLNVATAGAIIMYDRMLSLGKFAERPVRAGAPVAEAPKHVHGKPQYRGGMRQAGLKGRDRTTRVGTRPDDGG